MISSITLSNCAKSRRVETLESLRHPATGHCHAKVVEFQTLPEAIRAAEAGLGVIGGLMPLMNNFVLQGRLWPAFYIEHQLGEQIAFIFRSDFAHPSKLDAIFEWLVDCYRRLPPITIRQSRSGRGKSPEAGARGAKALRA